MNSYTLSMLGTALVWALGSYLISGLVICLIANRRLEESLRHLSWGWRLRIIARIALIGPGEIIAHQLWGAPYSLIKVPVDLQAIPHDAVEGAAGYTTVGGKLPEDKVEAFARLVLQEPEDVRTLAAMPLTSGTVFTGLSPEDRAALEKFCQEEGLTFVTRWHAAEQPGYWYRRFWVPGSGATPDEAVLGLPGGLVQADQVRLINSQWAVLMGRLFDFHLAVYEDPPGEDPKKLVDYDAGLAALLLSWREHRQSINRILDDDPPVPRLEIG